MSSRDDISRKTLSMPALGRHFSLGTVYDAVNDETIPGFTFWKGSDLKNVKTTRNAYTEFSIIASDKFSDKFEKLNVSGSLQVSILSGMIKLSGSANYLNKKKSTSRESSVHLTLQRRTAVKELTMEQLAAMRYPDIQKTGEIGSATHIVTQIEYGAEATLTFTKKLIETENEQEVNGQLKLDVEKFTQFLTGNANVEGTSTDTNKKNQKNIECRFQGNFDIPDTVARPTTYNEAIDFANKFLQFSSNWMDKDPANGIQSLGVPIKVFLHPLKFMQDAQGAPTLRYEISDTLASQCVLIMQNYGEVEDKLLLMLEDPLVKKLNPLQKKLQLFQQCLKLFIDELKMKFGVMVVGIRSGKIKIEDFSQLVSRIIHEQFPFNFSRLDRWLDQKHKELCIIRRFHEEAKNKIKLENDVEKDEAKSKIENKSKVHFFPSATTLQEEMTKFPVDFGFEFSFPYLSRPEPFLDQLNPTLRTNYFNEIFILTNNVNFDFWYENDSVFERIQKEIDVFAELVNNKSKDEKFAFAMTAPDKYNETCANEFSIIVHKKKKIFGWDAVLNVCQHYPKERILDIFQLVVGHFENDKIVDVIPFSLSVEEEIPEGWNPFPLLALCRYYDKDNLIDIVRLLIEKNIDVNCKDDDGQNALHYVCQNYNKDNLIDIVRLLIDKNIDVNCKTNYGWNALHYVCCYYKNENLIDIVQLLIEKNIDVHCKDYYGCWNALHLVCRNYKKENLIDIVRLLIQKNIDVTCKDTFGMTALYFVCQYYRNENLIEIVRLLIDTNIDVNCKNNDGWNALHFVCDNVPKKLLVDIVSILVRHKIDKKVKTTGGGTARSFLLNRFEEEEIADVLQMLDS